MSNEKLRLMGVELKKTQNALKKAEAQIKLLTKEKTEIYSMYLHHYDAHQLLHCKHIDLTETHKELLQSYSECMAAHEWDKELEGCTGEPGPFIESLRIN